MHNSGRTSGLYTRSKCFCFLGMLCLLPTVLPLHLTLIFLLSAALHECGHITVMRLLGIPIRGFRSSFGGAILHGDLQLASFRGEFLTAAAGPVVNLLLAMLFSGHGFGYGREVHLLNLMLAVYNLLPLNGNDGTVMLLAAAEQYGYGERMRRGLSWVSEILLSVLWMMGAWVFWFGALSDTNGSSVGYGALFFCILLRYIKKMDCCWAF